MTKRCWVYWIHLEEHTDITADGYIGITTLGVEERFKRHLSAARVSLPADSVDKPLQKIKSGWNPLEDEAWLAFRDKYLKEAHANSYAT